MALAAVRVIGPDSRIYLCIPAPVHDIILLLEGKVIVMAYITVTVEIETFIELPRSRVLASSLYGR